MKVLAVFTYLVFAYTIGVCLFIIVAGTEWLADAAFIGLIITTVLAVVIIAMWRKRR